MPAAPLLPALTRQLKAELQSASVSAARRRGPARTVVVLGVGSDLRSDDALGNRVAEEIAARGMPDVVGIPAGPAPENSSAELRALAPSHVVIVDAADMGEAPGTVRLLDPAAARGAAFATHGLPLGVLAGYLSTEIGCKVVMIGIQPLSVSFGESLSPEAMAGVHLAVQALADALEDP